MENVLSTSADDPANVSRSTVTRERCGYLLLSSIQLDHLSDEQAELISYMCLTLVPIEAVLKPSLSFSFILLQGS